MEVNKMPEQKEQLESKKKVTKQPEVLDDGKKIDLYINNNQDDENGISIMNVFHIMGKRFKIYSWLMLSTFLTGLLVPSVMYSLKDKKEQAVSLLSLDYTGAEEGSDPKGNKLDITYLKSSYIVNNALNRVTLSKNLSTAQVQNNLVITGILTDETKEKQEILDKLLQEKNSEYGKLLQEFTLEYRPQYVISINSVFRNGSSKVVLPSNDLQRLLNAVTEAYNDYFVETYEDKTLPNDLLNAINEESMDYLEILDSINESLMYLTSYCDEKATYIPDFRTTEGISFEDLSKIIDELRSTYIDDIYSDIYLNNIYKDKLVLKTYYEIQKRNAELDLVETTSNISTLQTSIDNYKNGKVVVNTTDGGTPIEVPHTDAEYNRLVLELTDMNEKKSALEETIATITDRLGKIDGPEATDEQKAKAEANVNIALQRSKEIYTLVNRNATELFNSNAYKNHFMHSITTTKSESFIDSAKTFVYGTAIGLVIGLVIWIGDAFVIEIKNTKKANGIKEAR